MLTGARRAILGYEKVRPRKSISNMTVLKIFLCNISVISLKITAKEPKFGIILA